MFASLPEGFTLSVGSDWHAAWSRANLEGAATNLLGVDQHVMLGDIVSNIYGDTTMSSYSYWNDTLRVLGNHDVYTGGTTSSGIYNWENQATQAQLYSTYFSSYVSGNGIDMAANTTWWSKDFPDKNVLLIGLNCMIYDTTLQASQKAFMDAKLQYALENDRRVFILYHWATRGLQDVSCSFTDDWAYWQWTSNYHTELSRTYTYEQTLLSAVDSFKQSGGRFIAWLHGHMHCDLVGYYTVNGRRQLAITTGAEIRSWCMWRSSGSVSDVLFNTMTLDDSDNLTMRRYGSQNVRLGGWRKSIKLTPEARVLWERNHDNA